MKLNVTLSSVVARHAVTHRILRVAVQVRFVLGFFFGYRVLQRLGVRFNVRPVQQTIEQSGAQFEHFARAFPRTFRPLRDALNVLVAHISGFGAGESARLRLGFFVAANLFGVTCRVALAAKRQPRD